MTAARKMTVEEWGELDDLAPYFQRRRGIVASAGPKLAIREDRGRVPDLVCWGARKRPPLQGVIRTPAPDVVVEVISPRPRDVRRDRIDKLADYAEMGAKQYWLVDPKLRTFEIWQLDSKRRYERVAATSRGKIRRIPSLPGLTIDVDRLRTEISRLEKGR